MASNIGRRQFPQLNVALTTALATTPEIQFEEFAFGTVHVPAGSSITTLTFYAAPFSSGRLNAILPSTQAQTFLALFDDDGVAVTLTVAAGNAYPLPPECAGAGALKMVSNASGNVDVSLKA